MSKRTIGLLVGLLAWAGCGGEEGGGPTLPEGEVPIQRIVPDAIRSRYPRQENLVIQDAKTWIRVWGEIMEGAAPVPNPPAVDFGRQMILAAFLGPRTGPAAITIARVEREGGRLLVTLAVREASGVSMERASPYCIVKVPRSTLPVAWTVAGEESIGEEAR